MVEVIVKLPESLAQMFGVTPEMRSRQLLESAAIEEYRSGRLSQRQVGELLGMNYWEVECFFVARKVVMNYSVGDLQADGATLDEILPLSR